MNKKVIGRLAGVGIVGGMVFGAFSLVRMEVRSLLEAKGPPKDKIGALYGDGKIHVDWHDQPVVELGPMPPPPPKVASPVIKKPKAPDEPDTFKSAAMRRDYTAKQYVVMRNKIDIHSGTREDAPVVAVADMGQILDSSGDQKALGPWRRVKAEDTIGIIWEGYICGAHISGDRTVSYSY
jgi:hypothetical protein